MPIGQYSEFVVNQSTSGDQTMPEVLGLADGRFAISWSDSAGGYARIFNADGSPAGDAIEFPSATTTPVLAALANGSLAVFVSTSTGVDLEIYGADSGFVTSHSDVFDGPITNDENGRTSMTAATDSSGRIMVTAIKGGWVQYRLTDSEGVPEGSPLEVDPSGFTEAGGLRPALKALPGGGFEVAWDNSGGHSSIVVGKTLVETVPSLGGRVIDFAVLPDGTHAMLRDFSGDMYLDIVGSEPTMSVLLGSPGTSWEPYGNVIALPDGRFFVTWAQTSFDGDSYAVTGQIVLPDGTLNGPAFNVATYKDSTQFVPSVAQLPDGRIVVTWASDGADGSDAGIAARIFGPTIFYGTSGVDRWAGGNFADRITGGGDDDTLSGGDGDDVISGDGDGDYLFGDRGNDRLFGGADNDHLYGGAGADTVYGGDGMDTIYVYSGDDDAHEYYDGGDGGDWVYAYVGANGVIDLRDDTLVSTEGLIIDTTSQDTASTVRISAAQARGILAFSADADLDCVTTLAITMGTESLLDLSGRLFSNFLDRDIVSIVGDGSAEGITGSSVNDIVKGGAGKDTIDGSYGFDTADYSDKTAKVTVNLGTLSGGYSNVTIGSAVEDKIKNVENIIGGSAGDSLTGNTLANLFKGNAGKDTIDGAAGSDTADYSEKTQKVEVALNRSTAVTVKVDGKAEDSIKNIENILGGSAGDKLTGDSLANLFKGNAGKDTIDGGTGSDTADYSEKTQKVEVALNRSTAVTVKVGGKAEDSIKNIENVIGGSAGDKLTGDALANFFRGGDGKDSIDGGDGSDTADYSDKWNDIQVALNTFHDFTVGGDGDGDILRSIENIIGGLGNDYIAGDSAANSLSGGDGGDTLSGGGGKDTLRGGDGLDYLIVTFQSEVVAGEIYDGGEGHDRFLIGEDGAASGYSIDLRSVELRSIERFGYQEPSVLQATVELILKASQLADIAPDADFYGTGLGNDDHRLTIYADSASTIDLSQFTFSNNFGIDDDDRVAVIGDGSSETIRTSIVTDSISAAGGNDTIYAGYGFDESNLVLGGNDTIDGGDGNDWVDYSRVTGSTGVEITLNGSNNATVAYGSNNQSKIRNIENIVGTYASDYLEGDGNDNVFQSLGGYDVIIGGSGNDTADYHENDADIELVIHLDDNGDGQPSITIVSSGDVFPEDELSSIENLIGGDGRDLFTGGNPANLFIGNGGDDTLNGGGGNDTLRGGQGADRLIGGSGFNTADFSDMSGKITVTLDAFGDGVATIVSGGGNDTLGSIDDLIGGSAGDSLTGNGAANAISGNAGADTLIGGGGNDTLTGGTGKDSLTGGDADDVFLYKAISESTVGANMDIITDFDKAGMGDDRIDLSALYGPTMTYKHNAAFTGLGQVRINDIAGADVIVEVNTTGSNAADFAILLKNTTLASMAANDFFL